MVAKSESRFLKLIQARRGGLITDQEYRQECNALMDGIIRENRAAWAQRERRLRRLRRR